MTTGLPLPDNTSRPRPAAKDGLEALTVDALLVLAGSGRFDDIEIARLLNADVRAVRHIIRMEHALIAHLQARWPV